MDSFRHGQVLFAGDSAHGVSPFGARGANSGVQDAENLAWKLAMVLEGRSTDALLDTYAREREYAADENIRNSTRSTDFITPKSAVSRVFRDAVLTLARDHAFARQLVNSGRLSVPAVLHESVLNTPDADGFAGQMMPGAACCDAPVQVCGEFASTADAEGASAWLLHWLGQSFTGLLFCDGAERLDAPTQAALQRIEQGAVPTKIVAVVSEGANVPEGLPPSAVVLRDVEGLAAARYDATPGTFYLIRPDQHVCARWRQPDADRVENALKRALCVAGTA
jgi:3-(3-hydroxy-phenyl)propionate hydroxylase